MALQVSKEVVQKTLAKSASSSPTKALAAPQWRDQSPNSRFGMAQRFYAVGENGEVQYEEHIRYETPGEINIVVKPDGAIAFITKYRHCVLPKMEKNIAWRNAGNLDILDAPVLGTDVIEVPRGWVFDPKKPWKMMTEGQQETGLVVENVQEIGHINANTGIIASWIDVSFGFATEKPYEGPIDESEQYDIKNVMWLTPNKVRKYTLEGWCGLSIAALGKFRSFALASKDPFLLELGSKF